MLGSPTGISRTRRNAWLFLVWLTATLAFTATPAHAQYFGRNKVQYRTFDFQILRTEHFDLYYYPEEAEAAGIVARMAERWHSRLSRFFGHELRGRQPLILYAVAAHFRQTNAIEGLIGEGTGGVTEALRRRVVLPMSGSLADSDHVLGHELVHAFQFDLTGDDPHDNQMQAPGILAFPLWFVEGMAEYLSLGPVDAQTAMWLRDAALREKLPDLKDLDNPKYFPYRWGHAFWAYVGAKYGDRAVASLIRSAANPRFDLGGLARQLGTDAATLTREWHDAIRASTMAVTDEISPVSSRPRRVIGVRNEGGHFNVGPEVSPDGQQIAFFSERDRFSIDLYLADAESGRIQRRLVKSATDPHFDSLEFINSAGAWLADGSALALTALQAGKPVLALVDPRSGDVKRELKLTGLDDAFNPVFAPDGKTVVVAGNVGGLIDLYSYTIATGRLERLTQDPFADLQPTFTPDGQSIVFVTERYSMDLQTLEPGPLRLAVLDLSTRRVRPLAGFLRGKHLSPRVSADGTSVIFVADPDGVSNLYRVSLAGGPVEQLTAMSTGIAGITTSSPAMSLSASGRLAFSVFEDDGHSIYTLDPSEVVALVPPPTSQQAALLPGRTVAAGDLHRLLSDLARGLPAADVAPPSEPYKQGLTLDEIGQPSIQTTVYQGGATLIQGGVSASFSDMLGDRWLGVGAQVGGTLADFGAQLAYLNRKHRWNWAAAGGVSPYAVGYIGRLDLPSANQIVVDQVILRQICRCATVATTYALNSARRLEFNMAGQALSFTREVQTSTYDINTRLRTSVSTTKTEEADPLYLGLATAAIVQDTTYFGATAPIFGARSRLEIGQSVGTLKYSTILADWRRYFMPARPYTIAVRGMHYGRYGRDTDSCRLIGLYLGYPEFVHGYGLGSFSAFEAREASLTGNCIESSNLIGSRVAVMNVELRAPVVGLFTGELEYGRLPMDVAVFADAGLSWTGSSQPAFLGGTRTIVRSVGAAVRFNLLGFLALELAASHPFDRIDKGIQWQLGIRQGF